MTFDIKATYEGVEALKNFSSLDARDNYRQHLLAKSAQQADFIRKHFPKVRTLHELCCGNGRLLLALANEFETLEGVDLSESRVAFAQEWILDLRLENVKVWREDILASPKDVRKDITDLVVCITGAFGYFDALEQKKAKEALERMLLALKPGGNLLFELYQHPLEIQHCQEAANKTCRTWLEFPEADPFRFVLQEWMFDSEQHVLSCNKCFIHRNGTFDERVESCRVYTEEEIRELLESRFEVVEVFGNWDGCSYTSDSPTLIVEARGQRN